MTVVITFTDILIIIGLAIILLIIVVGLGISAVKKFLWKHNILKDCADCKKFNLDNVNSCGDCWHTCKKGHFENAKSEIGQIHYIRHCRDFEKDSGEE